MPLDSSLQDAGQHIRAAIADIQSVIVDRRPIGDLAHLGSALKLLCDADWELCLCRKTERRSMLANMTPVSPHRNQPPNA